jgi:hypothetical protein
VRPGKKASPLSPSNQSNNQEDGIDWLDEKGTGGEGAHRGKGRRRGV